jgi:hypothetical protein
MPDNVDPDEAALTPRARLTVDRNQRRALRTKIQVRVRLWSLSRRLIVNREWQSLQFMS